MTECPRHLIPVAFHILLVVVRCPNNPGNVTSHTRFLCYANYHAIFVLLAKLRKVESKTKELLFFLPRQSKFAIFDGKVTKSRGQNKRNTLFFPNDRKDLLFSESETEADLQVGAEGMLFEVCVYVAVVVDVPAGTGLAI